MVLLYFTLIFFKEPEVEDDIILLLNYPNRPCSTKVGWSLVCYQQSSKIKGES